METEGTTQRFHSVRVDPQRCKGCGECIEICAMNAIRLRDGKAVIMEEKCIDCGECIRTCPDQAKAAVTDTLEGLSGYTYRIALLAPSLQVLLDTENFARQIAFKDIQDVFSSMGFDEVFEVASAAEVVTFITEQHILQDQGAKPLFSSSCPAVLRLICMRFPGLLKHASEVLSPMEVAARLAKEAVAKKTGLSYEEIGAFFLSPCPAKVTEVKGSIMTTDSAVDAVIGINLVYRTIVEQLSGKAANREHAEIRKATAPTVKGRCCANAPQGTDALTRMKVSGTHNVIGLLEDMERGRPVDVDFVELLACTGGCLGGPLNTRNLLERTVNLRDLIEKYQAKRRCYDDEYLLDICNRRCFASTGPILPTPIVIPERIKHKESG
ncbi:MAG: [Fe-Fe] hydrogenase large subunit C-terminal domain-containing protein [Syntrophorhabdaceae bacterium]|nr:[Fe-Fe] hydrogenase large subunit C-terminal domain-containing protein [Syntrophorhabdaceae bacterium]